MKNTMAIFQAELDALLASGEPMKVQHVPDRAGYGVAFGKYRMVVAYDQFQPYARPLAGWAVLVTEHPGVGFVIKYSKDDMVIYDRPHDYDLFSREYIIGISTGDAFPILGRFNNLETAAACIEALRAAEAKK